MITTCDLYDKYEEKIQVLAPSLKNFGGKNFYNGKIKTVKCYGDNSKIKELLANPGNNQVLVVDGAGSLQCALMGDVIARTAINNNWSGVVIFGCVRDIAQLAKMPLGVHALASIPRKSIRRGTGEVNVKLHILNVIIETGMYLYADDDGIVIANNELSL